MRKINKVLYSKEKMYGSLIALCWATIILCLILKLFGSKQFEMPEYTYNISDTMQKIINYIFYCINSYLFAIVLVKRKLTIKETIIVNCMITPLFIMSLFPYLLIIKFILELVVYFLIGKIILKEKWYKILLKTLLISAMIIFYQLISMLYKNINVKINIDNFIVDKIMMIDYYILMILTYLFLSKKGVNKDGQRFKFLVFLSNKRSNKKCLQQNSSNLQKESIDNSKGFKLFALMLAVFQFMLVFTLCYFINNTTWQFIVIFVSFCVLRSVFGKSYHCNSIINCTTLSCLIFTIATKLSLPSYISTLCNVIIGLLIAYLMYVLYYYNKHTNSQGITLSRGMSKEALMEMCSDFQFNEMEVKILTDFYVEKKSIVNIANSVGYSEDNVKKIKSKLIKRIID